MVRLPDIMPPSFRGSYRPIAAAGTHEQKKQLAKLLAAQLNEADGKSLSTHVKQEPTTIEFKTPVKRNNLIEQDSSLNKNNKLQDVYQNNENDNNRQNLLLRSNLPTTVRTSKSYKLADVTKLLNKKSIDNLLNNTFNRMLTFEGLSLPFKHYSII
jgi:hypothetical protein